MAKDNLAKAKGPEAKTEEVKAKGQKTEKERLQAKLSAAGVKGVEKMTVKQMRMELTRIKSEGIQVPDLRQGNSAPVSLNKEKRYQDMKRAHLDEEVEVIITKRDENGQVVTKSEKKATFIALLDQLRRDGTKAPTVNERVNAIHEYFDRTLGKARQEIEIEGEIKTEEQRPATKAEKAAAKAFLDNLDDEEV